MLIWGLFRNDVSHLFAVGLRSGRDHFKTCLPHVQQVAVPGLAGFNPLVGHNDVIAMLCTNTVRRNQ